MEENIEGTYSKVQNINIWITKQCVAYMGRDSRLCIDNCFNMCSCNGSTIAKDEFGCKIDIFLVMDVINSHKSFTMLAIWYCPNVGNLDLFRKTPRTRESCEVCNAGQQNPVMDTIDGE